eukprot:GHVN01053209.1.p1 GENE.GHVN01053209.1~~GHVN01053209.1.p1  ORF type:complete len:960 (+),score=106.50 GHVN01053209.1:3185-6064(+)
MQTLFKESSSAYDRIKKVTSLLSQDILFPQRTEKIYRWVIGELESVSDASLEEEYLVLLQKVFSAEKNGRPLKPSFFSYLVKTLRTKKEQKLQLIALKTFFLLPDMSNVSLGDRSMLLSEMEIIGVCPPSGFVDGLLSLLCKAPGSFELLCRNIPFFLKEGRLDAVRRVLFDKKEIERDAKNVSAAYLQRTRAMASGRLFSAVTSLIAGPASVCLETRAGLIGEYLAAHGACMPGSVFMVFWFISENVFALKKEGRQALIFRVLLPSLVGQGGFFCQGEMEERRKLFLQIFSLGKRKRDGALLVSLAEQFPRLVKTRRSLFRLASVDASLFISLFRVFRQKRLSVFIEKVVAYKLEDVLSDWMGFKKEYSETIRELTEEQKRKHLRRIICLVDKSTAFVLRLLTAFVSCTRLDVTGEFVSLLQAKDVMRSPLFEGAIKLVFAYSEQRDVLSAHFAGVEADELWMCLFYKDAVNKATKEHLNKKVALIDDIAIVLEYIRHLSRHLSPSTAAHVWKLLLSTKKNWKILRWAEFFELETMRRGFDMLLETELEMLLESGVFRMIPPEYVSSFPFRGDMVGNKRYSRALEKYWRQISKQDGDVLAENATTETARALTRIFKAKKSMDIAAFIEKRKQEKHLHWLFRLVRKAKGRNRRQAGSILLERVCAKSIGKELFRELCRARVLPKDKKKKHRMLRQAMECEHDMLCIAVECGVAVRLKGISFCVERLCVKAACREAACLAMLLKRCKPSEAGPLIEKARETGQLEHVLRQAVGRREARALLFQLVCGGGTGIDAETMLQVAGRREADNKTIDAVFAFFIARIDTHCIDEIERFASLFIAVHTRKRSDFFQSMNILFSLWLVRFERDPAQGRIESLALLFEGFMKGLHEKGRESHLLVETLLGLDVDSIYSCYVRRLFFALLRTWAPCEMDIHVAQAADTQRMRLRAFCTEFERERNMFVE